MTLLDIIQKASEAVTAGLEAADYPAFDAESIAEAHLETVFASVARRYASEGRTELLTRKTKTLSFASGSVTLTDDVLQSCLDCSELKDTSDSSKLYAYTQSDTDGYDRRLGYYWAPSQGTLSVIEPGEESASLTGDRMLTTPCVWDVPDGLDDDVDVSLEVAADLITALTEAIKASLPVREVAAA